MKQWNVDGYYVSLINLTKKDPRNIENDLADGIELINYRAQVSAPSPAKKNIYSQVMYRSDIVLL